MKLFALGVLTLLFVGGLGATTPEWYVDENGQAAIVRLENAPFPHESRANGFRGRTGIEWAAEVHYQNNETLLFIPKDYQPTPVTDLVVYFHGHGNDVRKSMHGFRLREQVVASGRNAILIFPQGPYNASDSGLGKLEEPDGLKNLVAESLAILYNDGQIPSTEPGSITITGHSGAYLGIAACLKHGGLSEHVNEVYLLDASYGRLGDITDWIIANPSARFGSIFTNHLADENVIMMSHLSRAGVPFSVRVDDALDSESERERVLFLYTLGLDHNGAVSWLERFLRAGTASAPAP